MVIASPTAPAREVAPPALDPDAALLGRLRTHDEEAFTTLVDRYWPLLLRLALTHVRTHAAAEEVVQETWLAVLRGLHRFEGRSTFKTWLVRILVNRAKTRAVREARSVPFSALCSDDDDGPVVAPERFLGGDHATGGGQWSAAPSAWSLVPGARLESDETLGRVRAAIGALPPRQRAVIVLRDVEGRPADEVCATLAVSEVNQRVLLHRARSKVRRDLELYFGDHR